MLCISPLICTEIVADGLFFGSSDMTKYEDYLRRENRKAIIIVMSLLLTFILAPQLLILMLATFLAIAFSNDTTYLSFLCFVLPAVILTIIGIGYLYSFILHKSTQTLEQRQRLGKRNVMIFSAILAIFVASAYMVLDFFTYFWINDSVLVSITVILISSAVTFFVTRWMGNRYLRELDVYWGIEARKQKQD